MQSRIQRALERNKLGFSYFITRLYIYIYIYIYLFIYLSIYLYTYTYYTHVCFLLSLSLSPGLQGLSVWGLGFEGLRV